MVMDATQPQQPSPQSVGREFVRQYYTLLNKAPNHLHRFYNNYSSFIHGESTLVVGQKNIHNRIQQLNFHDCHAKISQVDAQATLGNGVVVQVTGELSNDGQPMRRFTQTFVLAAQSPKKYYVHNDIFRYQDMYSDEENEGEVRSENGDELEQPGSITGNGGGGDQQTQASSAALIETPTQLAAQLVAGGAVMQQPPLPQAQQQPNAPQQHAIYYPIPAAGGRPVPVLAAAPQGAAVPLAAQFPASAAAPIPPPSVASANVSQLNGVVGHDDLLTGMQQQPPLAAAAAASAVVVGATPSAGTAAVQGPTAAMPVASVLTAPAAAAPAANAAALPQNSAAGVLNYQQPQLMQPTLVQPSTQPTPTQSASSSQISTAANINDYDEGNNNEMQSSSENSAAAAVVEPAVSMPLAAPIVDDFKTINEQQLQEKYEAAKQQQNEPKTYANLFKTTSTSPSSFVTAAMQQQQQVQQQQQQQQQQTTNNSYQSTTSIPSATFTQSSNASSMQSSFNRNANNSIDTNSNPLNQAGPLPQRSSAARGNKDYEQRRTSNAQQFGDNQQLFVGNIPHHASEDDLKALFARFGSIVELRILSKPGGGKMTPGVRSPLNYGFITYEEAESVQTCMAACPLYFPEGAHDAQKLNVEEKRPRMRDLPPRQSMNMSAAGSNSGNAGVQRNMSSGGGPQSRSSLSNSGNNSGMMRGSSGGGANNSGMPRGGAGSSSGQRMGGGFNRNDNRNSQSNGGGQMRGGSSSNSQTGGGGNNNTYAGRR